MIVDLALFPLYAAAVTLTGLGFLTIFEPIVGIRRNRHELYLYPITGLCTLGIIALIVNFFSAIAVSATYSLLAAFLLIGLFNVKKLKNKEWIWFVFIAAALTPLAAVMPPGYDAGLYHLPNQLWIRTEKIVFGLANLHGRFGFSSILEYIQAPVWLHNNFKLLSYNIAIFALSFILFLKNIINDEWNKWPFGRFVALLIAGSLAINHSYLNWNYTYSDVPAGLVFLMAFVQGWKILATPASISRSDLYAFSGLVGFAILLKLSTALIAVWFVVVVLCATVQNKLSWRTVISVNLVNLFVGFAFLIKNFIVSGCLLYPASMTCIAVPWSARSNAVSDAATVTAWARHRSSDFQPFWDSGWLYEYWIPKYWEFIESLAEVVLIAIIVSLLLNAFGRSIERDHGGSGRGASVTNRYFPLIFITCALVFWFVKAPTPRFGIGIFMALPAVAGACAIGNGVVNVPKWTSGVAIAGLLILVLKIGDTHLLLKETGYTNFRPIRVEEAESSKADRFGRRPDKGDQCWLAPQCAPYGRPAPKERYGYRVFIE